MITYFFLIKLQETLNILIFNYASFFHDFTIYFLSETKRIKSSTNVAHVISPPPLQTTLNSTARQPKVFSKPNYAHYILETASHTDIKVSVPFEAFQNDRSARMVALLKSDPIGLPTKPETINGNLVGMYSSKIKFSSLRLILLFNK